MSHSSVDALVDELVRDCGSSGRRMLIGIAGVPGSGKTTVVAAAAARLCAHGVEAVALSMDGFHFTRAQLDAMPVFFASRSFSPHCARSFVSLHQDYE